MSFKLLILIGILSVNSDYSNGQNLNVDLPLSVTYDLNYYLTSTGGKTSNGCEAWATSLKTGEYIYVSKCDTSRLRRLAFNIKNVLSYNTMIPVKKSIKQTGEYYMADFTDIKHQVFFGKTTQDVMARIVIDAEGLFQFTRYEGTSQQLKAIGFDVNTMITQNNKMPDDLKISINNNLAVVENVDAMTTYLLGSNKAHKIIALVFDNKMNYRGYSFKD